MLGGKGSYHEFIQMDEEVQTLTEHVNKLVKDNAEECKVRASIIGNNGVLWLLIVT